MENKAAWIGTIIVSLVPLLLILKSLYLDPQRGEYMDWFMTVSMLNTLIFPIISGFIITAIVQREYQEKTLRNILSAPTSRENFVIAKLAVWFLWYLTTLFMAEIPFLPVYACHLRFYRTPNGRKTSFRRTPITGKYLSLDGSIRFRHGRIRHT